MKWSLLKVLRADAPYEVRRSQFFRGGKFVALGFFVLGLLGAAKTYWDATPKGATGVLRSRAEISTADGEHIAVFLAVSLFGALLYLTLRRRQ